MHSIICHGVCVLLLLCSLHSCHRPQAPWLSRGRIVRAAPPLQVSTRSFNLGSPVVTEQTHSDNPGDFSLWKFKLESKEVGQMNLWLVKAWHTHKNVTS